MADTLWVVWAETSATLWEPWAQAHGWTLAGVSTILDDCETRWPADGVQYVIVNLLTPGSQDAVDWILRMRQQHTDTRWIVAMPDPAEDPQVTVAIRRFYLDAIYDWVFEQPGVDLLDSLADHIQHPRSWLDARQLLGSGGAPSPDDVALTWTVPPTATPSTAPSSSTDAASPTSIWARLTTQRRRLWQDRTHSSELEAPKPPSDPPVAEPPRKRKPAPPAPAVSVVRRRYWLILGAAGGVGTSTLVAALAWHWAQKFALRVGVIDASPTGGYLNLALGAELVDTGWESGHALEDVAGTWHRQHWLVPRGLSGPVQASADVIPWLAAVRPAPIDVWLVDGGLDWTLLGRGAAWWDGILGVVRPDWPALHAATRATAIWRDAPAFVGVVFVAHHPDPVAVQDWTDLWHVPTFGPLPAAPRDVDALWHGRGIPAAWDAWLTQWSRDWLMSSVRTQA